jgi:FKBP-type peptidyl-prolyl cis-trans isomerase
MNHRRKRRIKRTNFGYQPLESRQLLAGDVSVSLDVDNLQISGDSAANEIRLSGTPDGRLQVIAVTGTTINGGTTAFDVGVAVRNVTISLGDGNDRLTIENLVSTGILSIDLGAGDDNSQIRDINVRVLNVNGQAGNEVMQFHNTFSLGNITLEGQAGDDTFSITAMATSRGLVLDSGAGADTIGVDDLGVRDNLILLTGEGNDQIFMTGQIYAHKALIELGDGNDTLSITPQTSQTTAEFRKRLNIQAGDGDDSVFIGAATSTRKSASVDGGAGTDAVGAAGANLKRASYSLFENRALANVNTALEEFYDSMQENGIDTTPFGQPVTPSALSVSDTALSVPAGSAPLVIDSDLTLTGSLNSSVSGATVQIQSNVAAEDVLAFTNTSNITGTFNATNGTLTLTGNGTLAEYQAALRTITYDNTRSLSQAGSRVISFTVTTTAGNPTDSRTLTLVGVTPAALTVTDAALVVPQNSAAVIIDNQLTLTGDVLINATGATVTIGSFVSGEDVLAFTNSNGIAGSFNSTTGVLTLTGTASLSSYQAALRTITFDNTRSVSIAGTRTISFAVNTDTGSVNDSRSLTLQGVSPAVLAINDTALPVGQNSSALAFDDQLTLTGNSQITVSGATVSITNFSAGQDTLAFANANGISGSYNSSTGVLTLTGNGTLAAYQAALRTVTFDSTATVFSAKTINVVVTTNAGTVTDSRSLVPAAVLTVNSAPLKHYGVSPATSLDNSLQLTTQPGTNVTQARFSITGGYVNGQDVLAFANTSNITGSFDAATGVMTLTGNATAAEYQTALRSVSYNNTSTTTLESSRQVGIVVTTNLGDYTASRSIDLGDQLAIQAYAAEKGYITQRTASGLHYIIETTGNGTFPNVTDTVRVNYTGLLTNGTQFDANNNITFPLSGVIVGWQEGIPLFSVGGSGRLIIPSSLAYGPTGQGSIPSNAVLDFEIDLLAIV